MADVGIGQAKVEIYRERRLSFVAQRFRVLVDDVPVARVSNGKHAYFSVDPGEHTIAVRARLAFSGKLQVTTFPGELLRLRCAVVGQSIQLAVARSRGSAR